MQHLATLPTLDLSDLERARGGGDGIDFDDAADTIKKVKERASVCRALHQETQRLSGGSDPKPGTDAMAMSAATRACWKSFGGD